MSLCHDVRHYREHCTGCREEVFAETLQRVVFNKFY